MGPEDWKYDNGLRILVYPVVASSSIMESSPTYHRLCDMIDWMDENVDFPHYFHVLWPKEGEDDKRYKYKFENTDARNRIHGYDNVELIPMKFHATQTTDMTMCTRELREVINMGEGQRYYDAIWNDRPGVAPSIMEQVAASRSQERSYPPIINETQIIPREEKSFDTYSQLRTILGIAGPSTFMLYEREDQKQLMENIMRKYLNGETIREIQKNSYGQPPGLNTKMLDEARADVEKQDDPILINYGSKVYSQRKYEEAWSIADTLFSSGANVRMQVISPHLSPWARDTELEYQKNIDYFDIYTSLSKQEYLRQAAKAKIMVDAMEEHYEFNLTLAEVAYMGALPIVKDANWSRHMYGEDYPFKFQNKEQGSKMILHVYNNLEEYREEWIPKLRERFRNKLSFSNYVEAKLNIWNKLREEVTFDGDFYDLPAYHDRYEADSRDQGILKTLKRLPDEFTMEEFAEQYRDISENNVKLESPREGRKPIEHIRYYWAMKNSGIKDTCEDDRPTLDKSHCDWI